ncbi:hypothetical protein B0H14DRAFT_2635182 [Mycena olivaceomarginata]|nr:hypothetical protein B0H14DRAFT_2635182 [Mycena olivaceomarginata]
MPDWVDEEIFDPLSPPTPAPSPKKLARPGTRATRAEQAAQQVAEAWNSLLPQLEEPYALYQQASHGQRPSIIPSSIQHQCTVSCETSTWNLLPSLPANASQLRYCLCAMGYFLRPPPNPGLNRGLRATDPFRVGLGNTVLWSSNLRARLQARLEAALAAADEVLFPPAAPTAGAAGDSGDLEVSEASEATSEASEATPEAAAEEAQAELAAPPVLRHDGTDRRHDGGDGMGGLPPNTRMPEPPVAATVEPSRPSAADAAPAACLGLEEWGQDLHDGGDFLFLANIDTPAPMEELKDHLPPQATIVQAYDVGCVLHRSLNLPLTPPTSQISDSLTRFPGAPRFRPGVGLADLEGIERFWSRIRKLIGITRSQWPKQIAAQKVLRDCGVPKAELRQEWEAQKVVQSSIRSHAPARLRRELDKVLKLQSQIDGIEKSISEAKDSITGAGTSPRSLKLLHGLQLTHETLSAQAEALYSSLNIQDIYPELKGLPLPFAHLLVAMCDLKMNLGGRAVGSFQEWANLDQAVQGKKEPQGMLFCSALTTPALTIELKESNSIRAHRRP